MSNPLCYSNNIMNDMKNERIYEVTFTNKSSVFIQAMDEAHARRIIENAGGLWTSGERKVDMIIKSIEECE